MILFFFLSNTYYPLTTSILLLHLNKPLGRSIYSYNRISKFYLPPPPLSYLCTASDVGYDEYYYWKY